MGADCTGSFELLIALENNERKAQNRCIVSEIQSLGSEGKCEEKEISI